VLYRTQQYNIALPSAAQCITPHHTTVQYSRVKYITPYCDTVHIVQYNTVQRSAVQYTIAQRLTVQYSIVPYLVSTVVSHHRVVVIHIINRT
jgi:hypothetical protein